MKRIFQEIDRFVRRKPLVANIIFLIIGLVIPATFFKETITKVLLAQIKVVYLLIVILLLLALILTIIRLLKNRRIVDFARYYLSLTFAITMIMLLTVFLTFGPKENVLVCQIDSLFVPFVQEDIASEFGAQMFLLKPFDDIQRMTVAFPEIFRDNAATFLTDRNLEAKRRIKEIVSSIPDSCGIKMLLVSYNRLGRPTMINRIEGTLRFGKVTTLRNFDIRHVNGINYFSENYLDNAESYYADSFEITPRKLLLKDGATETIELYWFPPEKLRKAPIYNYATVFQLRKKDLFSIADEDYHYYLAKIYEAYLQDRFNIPPHRTYTIEDFSMVGVEIRLRIHHTYGTTDYVQNCTFGVLPNYDVDEIFFPFK